MATPVIMPRQGQTVESCIITKWHKEVGDRVAVGDLLFSYETDKAAFDEASTVDGVLLARFFEEDDDVPVLTNVCVIGEPGEDISAFAPDGVATAEASDQSEAAEQLTSQVVVEPVAGTAPREPLESVEQGDGRIRISPRARGLAERAGIDYTAATPSGPMGRIIERDIVDLIAKGPQVAAELQPQVTPGQVQAPAADISVSEGELETAYDVVPLTNIRKRIAEAMFKSLSTTAQLTIHTSFDATEILELRKKLKASQNPAAQAITLTDMVLYAVSRTLINHKSLNAHMVDDKLLVYKHVNLGLAVDTERGLMVPTIFKSDVKSLSQISADAKRLANACRAGAVNPDELQGGTFTVTNLGGLGVEYFTPVLNPPQTGILGVNTIVQRVRQTPEGLSTYPAMGLSLTFDHRAVDGAPAARFLKELKENLESFTTLLALE